MTSKHTIGNMNILITNDDGYQAKGIRILAGIMKKFGEVTVIAPKKHQSGMSMALLSQYLGHTQVETTMIYAHADTEMKRAAIQKADAVRKTKPIPTEIWADNEEMILKLSGLR